MVELVQSYRELCNSIDRVASRPFEPGIDVQADDYPASLEAFFLHLRAKTCSLRVCLLEVTFWI